AAVETAVTEFLANTDGPSVYYGWDEWVIAAVSAISRQVPFPEVGDTMVREAIFEAVEDAIGVW
ncbi:MAG: hypothetical protein ACOYOQ_14295, partial [Microthrixaceae bacterium]